MAEKDSKKRKRHSNGAEAPNKKVAIKEPAAPGKVQVTFDDNDGLQPVLLSTPGITAPKIPFSAYTKPLSSRLSREAPPKPNTHQFLLHSSKHPRLDYTASPTALNQDLAHYIAVFDPSMQQLRITPAHHLSLRTTLRSDEDREAKQRRTLGQQREELGREFGTKKAKKAIADKTVNAIVKDARGKGKKDDVQDAILESLPTAPTKTEEEELEATVASKPIPKPNVKAETVEEVYAFDVLVPPADARLLTTQDLQENLKNENTNLKFEYLKSHRISLRDSKDMLHLKAFKYMALLLEFNDSLVSTDRSGGKKVPKNDTLNKRLSAWPETLVSSVRTRFADATSALPKFQLQKLHTHICALGLYIDGWTTITLHLRLDLKVESRDTTLYFRELGCKVDSMMSGERERWGLTKIQQSSTKVAKLKLPLDFPKVARGRRKV